MQAKLKEKRNKNGSAQKKNDKKYLRAFGVPLLIYGVQMVSETDIVLFSFNIGPVFSLSIQAHSATN